MWNTSSPIPSLDFYPVNLSVIQKPNLALKESLDMDFALPSRNRIQTAVVLPFSNEVGRKLMEWFGVRREQLPTFRMRRRVRRDV